MMSDELLTRIKTAGIAGTIALILLLWSPTSFTFMVLIAACVLAMEWQRIADLADRLHPLYGLAYIAIPCLCLILLRQDSALVTLHLLLIVWAADIAAYFSGRAIGGPKIIPSISANKTWAGLLGAMLGSAIVAASLSFIVAVPLNYVSWLFIGAALAVIAQAGDFFASWLKRLADVKDSGNILPGHGGLLDRVDGLLFAAPVYTILYGLSHA